MNWKLAVQMAREQSDVTYQEWCDLYYSVLDASAGQIEKAAKTALPILIRNHRVERGTRLFYQGTPIAP